MTYKEFKEIIEMSGEYEVEVFEGHSVQTIFVFNSKGSTMCKLWGNSNFALDTIYMDNDEFLKEHWDTIFEFAKTPIEDRYPVKKYYVKLIAPRILSDDKIYLNKVVSNIEPTQKILYQLGHGYSKWKGGLNYISEFTMEEIEEIIPEKDRNKFEYIPVEED